MIFSAASCRLPNYTRHQPPATPGHAIPNVMLHLGVTQNNASAVLCRLPNYVRAISHLPPQDTLWPILAAMVLFAGAVVATGYFICDGTTPKGAAAGAACAGSLL